MFLGKVSHKKASQYIFPPKPLQLRQVGGGSNLEKVDTRQIAFLKAKTDACEILASSDIRVNLHLHPETTTKGEAGKFTSHNKAGLW